MSALLKTLWQSWSADCKRLIPFSDKRGKPPVKTGGFFLFNSAKKQEDPERKKPLDTKLSPLPQIPPQRRINLDK